MLKEGMPALYNRFHDSLYLNFAEAKAFQRELDTLFVRESAQWGQQRYSMRISFVSVRRMLKLFGSWQAFFYQNHPTGGAALVV